MSTKAEGLSIVVIGASGHLARTKIYPALFSLYCQGFLPEDTVIYGFARSSISTEEFRQRILEKLTCRYTPGESCADRMDEFLGRCHYVSGSYESSDSFLDLYVSLREVAGEQHRNMLFYLAIPPSIFTNVAQALGEAGFVRCGDRRAWSRVVIEKPFGKDRKTSDALTREMARVFVESQTYRIDHYLGKEVLQNLMVLRFANSVFEPIWDRHAIESVQISWKEDLGIEGRGGYFDEYGIIRDVMQNHLLQMVALVAMERPASAKSQDVQNEKVRVLERVHPVRAADLVIGQYASGDYRGQKFEGYREDPTVPADSLAPTFAAVAIEIDNERWKGVPFLLRAGKGLDGRSTEIRVRFRPVPDNLFCGDGECPAANELVIRVQPDEAIYLRITTKVPGIGMRREPRTLDLRYKAAFEELIPDAYEALLLDVIRGEKSLFIRRDELAAAWDIFTPVLHETEKEKIVPEPYAFGSAGPQAAHNLAARFGVTWQ